MNKTIASLFGKLSDIMPRYFQAEEVAHFKNVEELNNFSRLFQQYLELGGWMNDSTQRELDKILTKDEKLLKKVKKNAALIRSEFEKLKKQGKISQEFLKTSPPAYHNPQLFEGDKIEKIVDTALEAMSNLSMLYNQYGRKNMAKVVKDSKSYLRQIQNQLVILRGILLEVLEKKK
ncbi:hypothetical protein GF343_03460 [Candidatus Woesearchaeota archaeon]|nr:hypothetical protein [Candidatus Woesearchaeota archaeon]